MLVGGVQLRVVERQGAGWKGGIAVVRWGMARLKMRVTVGGEGRL